MFTKIPHTGTKKKSRIGILRKYIGKLGENGEFIPNKSYTQSQNVEKSEKDISKQLTATRKFYGATYLLDCIAETSGILNDLKSSFGDESKQILSLAYFLVIEGESAMYRFPKFAKTHFHPYENIISSQRISDIFASISENSKMSFFKKRAEKCLQNEYLAYDDTS